MANGAGAATSMSLWVLLVLPVMALIVAVTRFVSLASLVGSLCVSAAVCVLSLSGVLPWSTTVAILAITSIIVVQHQSNIRRLLAGTERRIGEPVQG